VSKNMATALHDTCIQRAVSVGSGGAVRVIDCDRVVGAHRLDGTGAEGTKSERTKDECSTGQR
jgi:hypothetical protein